MKHKIFSAVLAVTLACSLGADFALAKRLGGGGSFGGRSTYSRSYSPGPSAPYAPSRSGSVGQQSRPTNPGQAAPAPMPGQTRPGGMFGRLGWGMGGFLAGGLLGSMLFGHGMGVGGGGIGLLDILLIGLIAYFAVRLLRRRGPAANRRGPDPRDLRPDPHERAEQSWDTLRSQQPQQRPAQPRQPEPGPDAAQNGPTGPIGGAGGTTGGFGVTPGEEAPAQPAVPEGFSIPDFLEGAKTVYARLQHSWDRRDLNDIALFTTAEVLTEIKRQAAADPTPSKTELLLVNARMLEFREEATDTIASVLFDVLLREDASQSQPKQIREVWHFSRPTGDFAANWRLEGIQQLED